MKKQLLLTILSGFLCCASTLAQTTINTKDKTPVTVTHKVMLIPFEPRLYMSEIDHHINSETKMSAKQIKYTFRDGINEQLFKSFKNVKYGVVDLMEDTVKYKKDIEGIYQFLNYEYMKIPDQANYKVPVKEKEEKKIEKGQLNVETDVEARFMNARMSNPKALPALNSKYRCDVFIFINQFEIRAVGSAVPGEFTNPNANRKALIHYTVFTKDMKEINSGIAETEFESNLNNPKKINEKYISKLAQQICERTIKALNPVK
ncbi:MAG TPA: hypothetical protein PLU73_13400 [Bacteroidia bacterium]|nr:hypothetical protein [Bacteroidia bacterium]